MKTPITKWFLLFLSTGLLFAVACKKDNLPADNGFTQPSLPATSYDYTSGLPGFFNPSGLPAVNMNNEIATLGRVLFYDKFLSLNNAVACASCHRQENSFSDPNRVSFGFAAGLGARNAPAIFNLNTTGGFFWDSRTQNLYDMVMLPIQHKVEMGMESMDALEAKLTKVDYYAPLFKKAFGSEKVTRQNIAMALTQFLLSIRSTTDFEKNGTSKLTAEQKRGFDVFSKLHCQNCHGPVSAPYYSTGMFNIGLEAKYTDPGKKGVSNSSSEEGVFKVPSLKNLAVTGPYMHDGRFATLEEVVEHYNSGVVNHPNLSSQLKAQGWGNNQGKLNRYGIPTLDLSAQEKKDLVAFLLSLRDETMLTHPKFSDPFKN